MANTHREVSTSEGSNISDIFKGFQKLEFAKECAGKNPSLRIWSEDRPSSMPGGKDYKYFWVCNVNKFLKTYLTSRSEYLYEVIHALRPARLYLDIEFKKKQYPFLNGETRVNDIIKRILKICINEYDLMTSFEEVVILDSSDDIKFSHYVIFTDVIFPTNVDCKYFIQRFCEKKKILFMLKQIRGKRTWKALLILGFTPSGGTSGYGNPPNWVKIDL